jgi:hypothetical protein
VTVDKQWRCLGIAVLALWAILSGLLYYVNHYMPHGPKYDTGDIVCENDGRGPCGEQFVEDTSRLRIPEWAKLLRGDGGFLAWLGLGIVGVILISKPEAGFKK